MKNLKQLESELATDEQLGEELAYNVVGGRNYVAADDKRRDRPGSNIGNRVDGSKGGRQRYQCANETKG